ncbi:hypothetical protein ACJ77P_03025 [Syntrophus buswellii]|uniref:hypothetical protein n=1 Tax=Syntrophus buswellii TaxID=43774 RepID=UPI0038D460DF
MSGDSEVPEFSGGGEFAINKGTMKQHLPGPGDRIYDLNEIVEDSRTKIYDLNDVVEEPDILRNREPHEVLVIDGRGYEKEPPPADIIHDLVDAIEEKPILDQPHGLSQEEVGRLITETVEKMAREMIPVIAERVIREEIEKLKQDSEEEAV